MAHGLCRLPIHWEPGWGRLARLARRWEPAGGIFHHRRLYADHACRHRWASACLPQAGRLASCIPLHSAIAPAKSQRLRKACSIPAAALLAYRSARWSHCLVARL